jgi:hypothetical protein
MENTLSDIGQIAELIQLLVMGVFGLMFTLAGKFIYDHFSGKFNEIRNNTTATRHNTDALVKLQAHFTIIESKLDGLMGLKSDVNELGKNIRSVEHRLDNYSID